MCILVYQPADKRISEAMLADFHDHNPDGFGLMFAEDGKLYTLKSVPEAGQSEEDHCKKVIDLYNQHAIGRECLIHFRMRTHGDIDDANCHPYRVTDEVALMHNGVLSSSNPVDKSKSDTWHFIEYVLRPVLDSQPDLISNPEWVDFMSGLIGTSNKFGIMNSQGKICIVNQDSGVWHDGLWLSNTYAWTTTKFGYKPKHTYGYGYGYGYGSTNYSPKKFSSTELSDSYYEDDYGYEPYEVHPKTFNFNKVCKAAWNSWKRNTLYTWVWNAPEKAAFFLSNWYDMEQYKCEQLVYDDANTATEWIEDIFTSGSFNEATVAN